MADESSNLAALESLLGDRYTREARLAPAFLSMFPVFLLLIAWIGDVQGVLPGLLGLFSFFGVVRWISHIARSIGDDEEITLFRRWHGKPTTTLLRLNPPQRIHETDIQRFLPEPALRTLVEGRYTQQTGNAAPTAAKDSAAEDAAHPDDAADALDRLYEPVVRWLRESTRDNKLVFEENISYGFQRNFFSLRKFSLRCGCFALVVQLAAVYAMWAHKIPKRPGAVVLAVTLAILAYLLAVLHFVSEESVMLQGFVYARQLLNSFYASAPQPRPDAAKGGPNP